MSEMQLPPFHLKKPLCPARKHGASSLAMRYGPGPPRIFLTLGMLSATIVLSSSYPTTTPLRPLSEKVMKRASLKFLEHRLP